MFCLMYKMRTGFPPKKAEDEAEAESVAVPPQVASAPPPPPLALTKISGKSQLKEAVYAACY